jgi:four helix bundle protein
MTEKNKIEKFEDLLVWQESYYLAKEVYKAFKSCRDFGFRDQVQRAVVSLPSNIAEGYERQSNKEFIQFLFIAKGSCGELRTQLSLAIELDMLEKQLGSDLIEKTRKISAMLFKFIKARKEHF